MPTKIEWADEVWNVVTGCTPVSDGCRNCYAKRMAQRLKGRAGYPLDDPFRVTFHPDRLDQPLKWKKPRRIFVVSMGDLFHESVEDWMLDEIFSVIETHPAECHTYLILTKRPDRMKDYLAWLWAQKDRGYWGGAPWGNIWLGVSVSNQADADRWIPTLLQIPAAKRFVSYEPAIGPVDFKNGLIGGLFKTASGVDHRRLDLIIAGGESGPGARPSHPDWFRKVRDDCAAADVPFLFKQWGEWGLNYTAESGNSDFGVLSPGGTWYHQHTGWNGRPIDPDTGEAFMIRYGKKAAGRELDGQIHAGWPGE